MTVLPRIRACMFEVRCIKIYACVHGSMHEIDIYIHTQYIVLLVAAKMNLALIMQIFQEGINIKVDACNETVRVIINSGPCKSDPRLVV